ncbi:MAG: hypothetical protein AB7N76_25645 [Planctomycetota bacterium]
MSQGQERRKAILAAAARDRELLRNVPAVVAAGFGVLPLRRQGDVLTVACLPQANRAALRLLREVLELEVVATPFEDHLLREAIEGAYFGDDEPVNFPTFRAPDFLEDRESAQLLRQQKVERLGPASCELPPGELVLATLTFRTRLRNLDLPTPGGALPDRERTQVHLGELTLPWRTGAAAPEVFREDGELPQGTRLVLAQYRFAEYRHLPRGARVDDHNVAADFVTRFPFVIHPTEVQVLGVSDAGELRLHVYDHEERFGPGRPGRTALDYHFLSYGNRMHRRIDIVVHEVLRRGRAELEVRPGACPWGALELSRWLGVEQPPDEEMTPARPSCARGGGGTP